MLTAIMIAVVSCTGTDFEELTPAQDDCYTSSNGELTQIYGDDLTIEVGLNGDDETTRIAIDGDTWVTTWEEGDFLMAYLAVDGATFSKYATFSMLEYGANKSSFTGTHYEDYTRRIIYYPQLTETSVSNGTHYTWYDGLMYAYTDFSSQSDGLDCTYMIDSELVSSEDTAVSPTMCHIGAAADLRISFENFEDDAYTLTRLSLNNVPAYAAIDLTLGVEDYGFYKEVIEGSIVVDLEGQAVSNSASVSVKFNILPFEVAADGSINLTLYFENEAGDSYMSTIDIANASGSSVSFARATYNTINCSCDANDIVSNFGSVALSELSADAIPEFDTWVITDTTATATDFAGLSAAIEALNESGRQISLEFPNLEAIPAYAIFGEEAYSSTFGSDALVSVKADVATSVGNYAFRSCSSLESIDLPSATYVGNYAFNSCSSLTSINIPLATSVTGLTFAFCTSLTSIDMPSVTSIGIMAFYYCNSLSSIDIPASVTVIGSGAFNCCEKLTTINMATTSYIYEDGVIYNSDKSMIVSALSAVVSGELYSDSATSIDSFAFWGCTALTSADLPLVTLVDYSAFGSCTSLTSIDLPLVTSINYSAFTYCISLTSVSLATGDGVQLSSIGSSSISAFVDLTTTDIDLTIGSANSSLVSGSFLTVGDISHEFKSITIVDGEGNVLEENLGGYAGYTWNLVVGDNGDTTGTWTEGLMGGIFSGVNVATKEVEVYEAEEVPGLYRIENIYTADFTAVLWGCSEEEEAGYAIDPSTLETPIYTYIHAEDPNNAWVEFHNSGYYIGSTYGYFLYGSYVPENTATLTAFGSAYTAGGSTYGTDTDGYMVFPSGSFITGLSAYSIGWYGGTDLIFMLPGAVEPAVEEPEASEEWVNFELTSGEYDMKGYSYFDSAYYTENIVIDYDATTGAVGISGLFYGYSSTVVAGTYDKETQTISVPDWQNFGTFSFSSGDCDVYFANASDENDIVFTLNSEATAFETSQMWGYYVDGLGWYEAYSSASIFEHVDVSGVIASGAYTLSGYSYFDSAWYSEDVTLYCDSANGTAYLMGLFYGYSDAVITGTYDSAAGTISLSDWQNLGLFGFSSGDSYAYFANAESEDDIVFTVTGEGKLETSQWWGYYLYELGGWYDVYTAATLELVSASSVAPSVIESMVSATSIETTAKTTVDLTSATAFKSAMSTTAKVNAPLTIKSSALSSGLVKSNGSARQINPAAARIK